MMMRLPPRHSRFMIAFGIGLVVALVTWAQSVPWVFSLLTGVNAFFIFYLGLMVGLIRASGPAELRRHAGEDDEGVVLILLLALLAVVVSVTAIFLVLNGADTGLPGRIAALISLPLGWTTLHVLAAFRYAHLYYRSAPPGLTFPGKGDPDAWDFLYFSFTIGMTAQVSDVVVETRPLRQAVLVHGVASFLYNTCILAVAVNAAVTAGL